MHSIRPDSVFRKIRYKELPQLLTLYCHLHPDDPELALTPDLEVL